MNRLRRRLAAALALLISCAACADVKIEGRGVPEAAAPAGLFAAPQPWTKDVSGLAPSARSDAVIAALTRLGGWGNGNRLQTDFSMPLLVADAATPRGTITAPAATPSAVGSSPAMGKPAASADVHCSPRGASG